MKLINLFLKSSFFFRLQIQCFLIVYLFSFSSCYAQNTKFKNTAYSLESVFVAGQKNKQAKNKATLQFNVKQNTARCTLSCNTINLNYTLKKNSLKFTSVLPDSFPCPDNLIGLQEDLKENFSKINTYLIKGDKIYFFNAKDTLLVFHGQ